MMCISFRNAHQEKEPTIERGSFRNDSSEQGDDLTKNNILAQLT